MSLITPCKFLPDDLSRRLVSSVYGRIPCLGLDQNDSALITDHKIHTKFSQPLTGSQRLEFWKGLVDGDSGNPVFMLINTGSGPEPVLMTVWTTGWAGGGTELRIFINDINQLIVDSDLEAGISTLYTVDQIDLSSFNEY